MAVLLQTNWQPLLYMALIATILSLQAVQLHLQSQKLSASDLGDVAHTAPGSLKDAVEEVERERILDALRVCAGNQTKAAQMLGISRRTLLNRLDQYGLPRPRK